MAAGRHAALVVDANTGAVMTAQNADEPRYPASLTKMMTLYVVFDLIERGKLTYQTRIAISDLAAATPPSKLGLPAGADIALIDAIKALIVKSANDIAVAIAEHVAGSPERFARLMTEKSHQIGMASTTFRNPHGLPDSSQVTTARDMVTLALHLHDDFPKHYALFATREIQHKGESHRNHNTLLDSYEGTDGIKTGYTSASGFNIVTSVKRGSKHVVGVVFGGSSAAARNQTMRTLLNLAILKANANKTRQPTSAKRAEPAVALREAPQPAARPVRLAQAAQSTIAIPALAEGFAAENPTGARQLAQGRGTDISAAGSSEPKRSIGTVEMARVRPILVAPRTIGRPETAGPMSVESQPLVTKWPPIGTAVPTAATPPQAVLRPALAPPAASQPIRGASPSTLQQQADNIDRGGAPIGVPAAAPKVSAVASAPTPQFRLAGPPPPPSGGYQVQIGAYASASEAERQIATTRERAADILGAYQGVAIAIQANGRALYRARYAGFDAASAGSICTELRRRQIDCMVAKGE